MYGYRVPGVAIAGKLSSGKTTLAKALVDDLGFTLMSFADELKRVAKMIPCWITSNAPELGYSESLQDHTVLQDLRDELLDKRTRLGRAWLQWLGTDCLRTVIDDVWTQALLNKVKERGVWTVVDDLRFPNEADALREEGFVLVRIETPEDVLRERRERLYGTCSIAELSHSSETALDNWEAWDLIVDGTQTRETVKAEILNWVKRRFQID